MMGNVLRKDRANRTKSKEKTSRFNIQMCPNGLKRKKRFWDKKVLETTPSHQTELVDENDSSWKDIDLTVADNATESQNLPTAPPRKKRHQSENRDEESKINGTLNSENDKNLSEESIINNNSIKMVPINQHDEIDKCSPNRSSEENNALVLTHKVPKVGNKKSDRFFGEKLSDLSNEPIHNIENKTEYLESQNMAIGANPEFLQENDERREEELMKQIAKEKGNMLFTLTNTYSKQTSIDETDRKPVIEELIVPIKKLTKHICDNDEVLSIHLHNAERFNTEIQNNPHNDFKKLKESSDNVIKPDEASDKIFIAHLDASIVKPKRKHKLSNEQMSSDVTKNTIKTFNSVPSLFSQSEKLVRQSLDSFISSDIIDKAVTTALALREPDINSSQHFSNHEMPLTAKSSESKNLETTVNKLSQINEPIIEVDSDKSETKFEKSPCKPSERIYEANIKEIESKIETYEIRENGEIVEKKDSKKENLLSIKKNEQITEDSNSDHSALLKFLKQ